MKDLIEISRRLTASVNTEFKRYLFGKINWNNRLIGIKGARGTGKTTMLLQWLQEQNLPTEKAVYLSLDDLYFSTRSLLDTVSEFQRYGGKVIVLDEVHKYTGWAREIKNIYDRYPDLKIIFTGSSIINISREMYDLSRRVIMYELPGLSFREYLKFNNILNMEPFSLDEIVGKRASISKLFSSSFLPLEHFSNYLRHGFYPFYNDNSIDYYQRLNQLVRLVIESDMAEMKGFDIRSAKKMVQLLAIIAQQVPFKPNIKKLAEKSGIHRNSMNSYLIYLEEARLIKMLYPAGVSISTLQKPEKIYLENTNMMNALAVAEPEKGNVRETFFFNQVSVSHNITLPLAGDFDVDGKYIFEVGGKGKGRKQIENLSNAFIVKDDLEYPVYNDLPLWLFGFLY